MSECAHPPGGDVTRDFFWLRVLKTPVPLHAGPQPANHVPRFPVRQENTKTLPTLHILFLQERCVHRKWKTHAPFSLRQEKRQEIFEWQEAQQAQDVALQRAEIWQKEERKSLSAINQMFLGEEKQVSQRVLQEISERQEAEQAQERQGKKGMKPRKSAETGLKPQQQRSRRNTIEVRWCKSLL